MRKSTQVAIGGVASSLCLLMMFLTGLIPFSTYCFPAFAGIVLIAVAEENGPRTAVMVYVATSVLSLFIVPDREAVMLFIMLLGYYPTLKPYIERLGRLRGTAVKAALFNGTVIVPEGYPYTKKLIEDLGYPVLTVNNDEVKKIDGSLTCLSLRF